jgi:hypothetical protein
MKTIKITDREESVNNNLQVKRIINPMYVTNVKLVKSEYNNNYCVVINTTEKAFTLLSNTQEEAIKIFDEINECLESIK